MKCTKCGTDLTADAKFCGVCGTHAPDSGAEAEHSQGENGGNEETKDIETDEAAAAEDAAENELNDAGAAAPENEAEADNVAPIAAEPGIDNQAPDTLANEITNAAADKKPDGKKNITVPVIAAAALLVAFGAITMFGPKGGGGSGGKNADLSKVVYFTEDSMMLGDLKGKGSTVEVTDSWNDEADDYLPKGLINQSFLTKDGKTLYYMEDYEGYTFDLHRASVSKPEESTKIDSNVSEFTILDNGSVFYMKKDTYYLHNGKDKQKFGKDMRNVYFDEAQKAIIWEQGGSYDKVGDLYYQPLDQKQDKVKLETTPDKYFYSKNLDRFYILKRGTLTGVNKTGDKETLIKKIDEVLSCDPEKGTVYFWREAKQTVKVGDDKVEIPTRELYYYANGQEQLISDRIIGDTNKSSQKGQFCMFSELAPWDELKLSASKVKISGLTKSAQKEAVLKYLSGSDVERYVRLAVKTDVYDLSESIARFYAAYADEKAEVVYALGYDDIDDDDDDESEEQIYRIPLTGKDAGKAVTMDSDVQWILAIRDKGVFYVKDYDQDTMSGDLYYNGEYIMSDVYRVMDVKDAGLLVCITDFDEEDHSGTVMTYDGKKTETIKDDVSVVDIGTDGTLLMLADYSDKRGEGDLIYYDGKEQRLVDDDVKFFSVRYGSNYFKHWRWY